MRVVTYNIHKWQTIGDEPNFGLVASLLKGIGADVIGLNEVLHPRRAPAGAALSWLAGELGMSFAFSAREPKRLPGHSATVASGDAVLSRFPFASVETGLFAPVPEKKQRRFLEARLDLGNGRTCRVAVIHLDHTDERTRLTQVGDLFAWCRQAGGRPDLIIGDCNCIHPGEYEHRPHALHALSQHPVARHLTNGKAGPLVASALEQAGYVDALIHKGIRGGGTFVPAREPVRLDYIWLRSDWARCVTHAGIVDEPAGAEASDHRPVVADFELS